MWDGFNKRKFPRLELQCEIHVTSTRDASAPLPAVTQNVGAGGVCVILDKELTRFDQCRLSLDFGSSEKARVECEGKVVWVVKSRDIKARRFRYDTGIEFTDLPEDQREKLETLIADPKLHAKPASS